MGFDCGCSCRSVLLRRLELAVECGALSADHLESVTEKDIQLLAKSNVIPVALPGASLGSEPVYTGPKTA